MMPGAARLLGHLRGAGVPLAVATSTPRRTYDRKMSGPAGAGVAQLFGACTCGDEVHLIAASTPSIALSTGCDAFVKATCMALNGMSV
jgi:beta-phosphoglucomutase-like phosphatase (HAD superfamily)